MLSREVLHKKKRLHVRGMNKHTLKGKKENFKWCKSFGHKHERPILVLELMLG